MLRGAARGTRLARAQALKTYFLFLELRHKAEIHQMTGHVVECPADEVNRPRGSQDAALRIPPSQAQVRMLFAGWRGELAECRKFAPAARNYAAAKLMELRQTEPLWVFDQHYGGVRHVDAHFDDGRRHQDLDLSPLEVLHHLFLLRTGQATMQQGDAELRKDVA